MGGTGCRDCAHYSVCAHSGKKCSEYMSAAVASGSLPGLCIYNEGVECTNHEKCSGCGWNPREIEERKKQIRAMEARGETPYVQIQARSPLIV